MYFWTKDGNMDRIQFDITRSQIGDYLTTNIFVNDYDLRGIISKIEYEQLKPSHDQVKLIGAYEGLSPFIAFHLHNHFCKQTINEYRYTDDQFALLEYMHSGVPGDHTLTCKIDMHDDVVRWRHFKLFSKIYPNGLDYGALAFEFEKTAYIATINRLKEQQLNEIYA